MAGQIRMSPSELRDRAKKYGTSAREIDQIQGQLEKTATSVENHDRELSQNFGLN